MGLAGGADPLRSETGWFQHWSETGWSETGWFHLPIKLTCLAKASLEDRPIFCEIGVDFALSTPEIGWCRPTASDLKG